MGLCLSAQAEPPTPAKPAPGSVQVMFLPPPLEAGAVYSVGVYETKTGRLVRRLHEEAEDGAFTAGLNGFITFWDRMDDAGKIAPAGRYAARGWALGEMNVEGVDILGNDWAAEDEGLRIKHVEAICLLPEDDGLAILATGAADKSVVCRLTPHGQLVWHRATDLKPPPKVTTADLLPLLAAVVDGALVIREVETVVLHRFDLHTGADLTPTEEWSESDFKVFGSFQYAVIRPGRFNTMWMAVGEQGLFQIGGGNLVKPPASMLPGETDEAAFKRHLAESAVRRLPVEMGDPVPITVSPSTSTDRLYLLEESPGWQRVRGLEWSNTKPDAAGRPVSEWRTFFERSIRQPDPALGLDEHTPSPVVELPLAKNPLEPGKPQRAKLRAGFDARGSFLETADGLRLLPVSTRPNLRAARLARDPKDAGRLLFYQFDGAAWDVFSVTGVPGALVGFDAGEFELTADGERRPPPPTDEPHDP